MLIELEQKIRTGNYDFIDFGCYEGESIVFGRKAFGGRKGLGIDIKPENVQAAIARGEDAVVCDATQIGSYPDVTSFSVMSHFLEHLPGLPLAMKCIESAVSISRDFVFIRQPWFDADGQLLRNGLKLYWSDWRGHTNPMTTLDFYRAIRRLEVKKPLAWAIYGAGRIRSSANECVLPVHTKPGRDFYNLSKDGRKPFVRFDFPVFRETMCVIQLSDRVSIPEIMNFARNNRFSKGSLPYRILNSRPFLSRHLSLIYSSQG